MRHYRVNKVVKEGGMVIKTKDKLAASDRQALEAARDDEDCPVCEIWRDGQQVGTVR